MFTQSARYYDAIYAARGKDYGREAELLQSIMERYAETQVDTLLDVACGTGGHLEYLQRDYEVVGLDMDEAMLAIARSKLPRVPLQQGDMVDFELGQQFDAVLMLFSSIGYARTMDRLERTIANLARHTSSGGVVIVEPWIYPRDFKPGEQHAVFVDQPELKIARMDVIEVDGRSSDVNFHYLVAEGGKIHYFTEVHRACMFTHQEYLNAFREAGLMVHRDPEGLIGRGLYIGQKPAGREVRTNAQRPKA